MDDRLARFRRADTFPDRLVGLAWRDRSRAGPGLLIPRCAGVHTFGMRFALDLFFLDSAGEVICMRPCVPPRRIVWCRGASAVLEIPAGEGGEFVAAGDLTPHAAPTRRDRQSRRLRGRRGHP